MRLAPIVLLVFTFPAKADIYARQPTVDVVHYEIALELPESGSSITGTTRVHIMMRQDAVARMWLDFEGMTVETLKVGGAERPFTHRDGKLSFEFERGYRRNEIAVV